MTKTVENVADIIDLGYLQAIQDSLGRIVGITTALLDPQGASLTKPTNLHAFCAMMQASEKGLPMCMGVNAGLIEKNIATKEPAVVTCANSGLKTAAVPIFLGDRFLGSWLIGQIRMSNLDEELIERTAVNAGLSKDEAKKNFESLPVISAEEFENILSFLVTVSKTLVDMVEVNDVLDRRNTELTSLTQQLDRSLHTFKSFIDCTDMGAYLVDFHTGELIMCNDTYRRLAGIEGKDIKGLTCFSLMGFKEFCSFCPKQKLVDEDGRPTGPFGWENYNEIVDQWLSITSRTIPWVDGRLVLMTTFIDITARKKQEEHITYLAYNDQRLCIPNNVKLFSDVNEAEGDSYMICLNVQGLRKINDAYGRDVGDGLLHNIVDWVKALPDSEIEIYRVEGGEFAILAKGYSESEAMKLAAKIHERFDEAWVVEMSEVRQNMYAGAHLGVLKTPRNFESLSALLDTIERVMSFAREDSSFILFDDEMNANLEARIRFEIELKACVLNGMQGFSLHYQPIVQVEDGRWVGLEALCRWESPRLGAISPVVFIDEIERLGLIDILSSWVMDEAVRQIKEWHLDEIPGFVLDVNLSPLQLRDRELVPKVRAVLEKHAYPPEKLSLEITETAEVNFDGTTLDMLAQIKETGVSLSLDDFGSGYATFSNLNNLPVDCLKTDRSFVKGIEKDAFLQQTVRSVVELARAAGLLTIAEGVETESQRLIMVENGVDRIQGYFYSKPLSVSQLSLLLDRFVA